MQDEADGPGRPEPVPRGPAARDVAEPASDGNALERSLGAQLRRLPHGAKFAPLVGALAADLALGGPPHPRFALPARAAASS